MVQTVIRYFPADENIGLPAIVVQVVCLTGSYMVWAGTTDEAVDEQDTPRIISLVEQGRLGRDWACAMPSPKVDARTRRLDWYLTVRTCSLRSRSRGPHYCGLVAVLLRYQCHRDWVCGIVTIHLHISNKIEAQRFKKQYFVSIDILSSHESMGQESFVALALEKQVIKTVKELQQ
jgi:hypothetical protein